MRYNEVKEFNKYSFVKAFSVPRDEGRWRVYSWNIEDDMRDLRYYKEFGEDFNITPYDMIRTLQSHTTNIYVASDNDRGLGVTRMEPETPYDGMITNVKNLMLLTVEADCTPVYILDPVNRAIGMVHSGWRGTVANITKIAIDKMKENYGTKIEDVIIHFGPAICGNCYEVGIELIDEFKKLLTCDEIHKVFRPIPDKAEKYLLDVTLSIKLGLLKNGVKEENITRDSICTYHDMIYHSWRREHDKTKQMLTGIMLI